MAARESDARRARRVSLVVQHPAVARDGPLARTSAPHFICRVDRGPLLVNVGVARDALWSVLVISHGAVDLDSLARARYGPPAAECVDTLRWSTGPDTVWRSRWRRGGGEFTVARQASAPPGAATGVFARKVIWCGQQAPR